LHLKITLCYICIWNVCEANTITIEKVQYSTTYSTNKLLFIGDSLIKGYYAGTYIERLSKLFVDGISQSGGGDKTREVLVRLPEVLNHIKPKQVVLMIGTNDIGQGIDETSFKINHHSIVDQLEAAGINVIVISPPAINGYDAASANTWMAAEYVGKFISGYTLTKGSGTDLNPIYDSGDGVHLNSDGFQLLADNINSSGLLI